MQFGNSFPTCNNLQSYKSICGMRFKNSVCGMIQDNEACRHVQCVKPLTNQDTYLNESLNHKSKQRAGENEQRFGNRLTRVENDRGNKQQKALLQTRALLENMFYDGHVTKYISISGRQFGQNHHI